MHVALVAEQQQLGGGKAGLGAQPGKQLGHQPAEQLGVEDVVEPDPAQRLGLQLELDAV